MADIVWITGPPGVGKTSVAWLLWRRRADTGERVAFVDTDQLEIVRPDPPDDPGRHRLGIDALRAVVAGFAAAGAERVVVSGVTGSVADSDRLGHPLRIVQLRCDREERARRLTARGFAPSAVSAMLDPSDEPVEPVAGNPAHDTGEARLDTTGTTVEQATSAIERLLEQRAPGSAVPVDEPADLRPCDIAGVLLTGAPGAGTSTIGWATLSSLWRDGVVAGYLDADQLGFSTHLEATTVATNLAGAAKAHVRAGTRRLVVVAHAPPPRHIREFLPNLVPVRLRADPLSLATRMAARAAGGGPNLAGNVLAGLTGAALEAEVARSCAVDADLTRDAPGLLLDSSGLGVDQCADALRRIAADAL